jgi:hypothetical protein
LSASRTDGSRTEGNQFVAGDRYTIADITALVAIDIGGPLANPGYDTPNGIFKANRMDADHLSQEWDNAPMPHTIFFDVRGHAVHGFFDVKHLGLPVSHGCVRLSPAHAATLFNLVKAEGMNQTTIVVSGHTPAGSLELVSRRAPVEQASTQPLESAPGYGARSLGSYDTQGQQPYYAQQERNSFRQQQTYYPPHPTLVDQLLRLFSPN